MARAKKVGANAAKPLAEQIQRRARKKAPVAKVSEEDIEDVPFDPNDFVSSGSVLLNLALTNHPDCGWKLGRMANVIGDSGAGKTVLCMTSVAETCNDDNKQDVNAKFDDGEHAYEFNTKKMFGRATAERLRFVDPPSENIETFSDNLRDAINEEEPFIYIMDSFDSLGCEDDTKHLESERLIRQGKSKAKSKGSYGTAKPKLASQLLREECGKLSDSRGALLIISQTRDNLNAFSYEKKTRSGGKALKFYATHEVWIIYTGAIKEKDRQIGAETEVKVRKNKITGKKRSVKLYVFDDYGVDDIGSCVDFLVSEKWWSYAAKDKAPVAKTKTARAPKAEDEDKVSKTKPIDTKGDLGNLPAMSRAKLIQTIEDENLKEDLKQAVAACWWDIEEAIRPKRRAKYE
jgi:recombination protein RecA